MHTTHCAKLGSTSGWSAFHDGDRPAGAFGSWKTSASHTWHNASDQRQTPAQRADLQRQIEAMQKARDAERQGGQAR